MKLIIISGLSGSGKSIALHTLEDLGYYCIDNLPAGLLGALALLVGRDVAGSYRGIAVGIDARNRSQDLELLPKQIEELTAQKIKTLTIYLEAEPETLLKRFSETRRRHPLSDDDRSLAEAIAKERELLGPIKLLADLSIDTTHTTVHQLRDIISKRLSGSDKTGISILIESFGFKHGTPKDADFVFDVRCLPNPYWETKLRALTGLDQPVQEFLLQQDDAQKMVSDIGDFLCKWIDCFEQDNRSYLTIAIGCTGGQHRSIFVTEALAKKIGTLHQNVLTRHRELS